MKINAFKQELPEIKELFADKKVEERIRKTLLEVLNYLEIDNPEEVIEFTLAEAKNYVALADYERNVHQLFDKKRITQRIPVKLFNRAQVIFGQIKDYLQGHQIMDLGCGDGKVGELISKQGRHVVLADVYEHGNLSNLNLPFVKIPQNNPIPFDNDMFDTTLILTVLHHSDDPGQVVEEAKRVTKNGGKILVIESVYGVDAYGDLSEEQQRVVNCFFDHFYNRVIHYSEYEENKVNIPLNFQTPPAWEKFFAKHGLLQEKLVHLGFDQPTVPEYHTLHVLKVEK